MSDGRRDLEALLGGGELAGMMRAMDWSRTALGPVEQWPQSLRTSVGICLNSRFPILLWWGPDLVMIYNDAYAFILGEKHPSALGARGRDIWPEIWPIIGPMLEGVLSRGEATWSENTQLLVDRKGFLEESYFTFSYSPIRDESGVGGVFTAVTETTQHVLGERRLRTLRDLATRTLAARTADEVCGAAAAALDPDRGDVRFALLYLIDPESSAPRLAATTHPGAPEGAWPLREVIEARAARAVEGFAPVSPDSDAARALVIPISHAGQPPRAVLVAGLSPLLALDDAYRGFVDLVAVQLAAALDNARAVEQTRRRADALAELDRAKTVFFSNVSHEFRTPLTLLLGPLDDLAQQDLGARAHGQVQLAQRSARRLLKLVNTLLDFSRIQAGREQATYEPTDLAALTVDLASLFRSAIERAGLLLRVDCPPLPEPVYVDREMYEKIVLNLLSNAFKFTLEGSIEVSLRSGGGTVELAVADTGTGIPAAEQERVFERFHRIEGARGRSQEGTGIGLALSQELVKLHGGTIRVQSEPGRGTRFLVTLPLGSAHLDPACVAVTGPQKPGHAGAAAFVDEASQWMAALPEAIAADRAPQPLVTGRILLADDNADMRDYIARTLSPACEVEAVADGQQALEAIRMRPPDLVLSDVMMPGLDGFALLRALRGDPATASIPVMLISARAGEEAHVEGRQAGADDYLVKPFSARELVARVQSQLALSKLRQVDRTQRGELQRLFQGAPFFIARVRGPEHVFDLANDAYVQLVGSRELLGRKVRDALPEVEGQGFFELLDDVYRSGRTHVGRELPVQLQRTEGAPPEQLFITFNYEPWRSVTGNIEGVIAYGFDVTDMVAARTRSEELAEQALRADRTKDEFLAMLGHELRNPLAPIVTAVKLMELRGDDRSRRERQVIERQVTHLARLLDDLLDVSRIAQGKINLALEQADVADLAAKAVEMASPLLETRAHRLDLRVPRGQLFVNGDPVRLAQVIGNLLTNAAKYTPPGGQIALSASGEADRVVIRVKDNGIGIAADFLPRVFDLFAQSTRTLDRAEGGLGLGLAVVKNLVALHGGDVSARSDGLGRGSEFTVRLPRVEARAAVPAAPAPSPATGSKGHRVLVVDDNIDAAELLAETLSLVGHEVAVAHDGPEALRLQQGFHPDVAVLDIGLPVMDGYELATRMRQAAVAPLRLVALTGYGQAEDRERSAKAGFDAHLVKPVEIDELIALVARLGS